MISRSEAISLIEQTVLENHMMLTKARDDSWALVMKDQYNEELEGLANLLNTSEIWAIEMDNGTIVVKNGVRESINSLTNEGLAEFLELCWDLVNAYSLPVAIPSRNLEVTEDGNATETIVSDEITTKKTIVFSPGHGLSMIDSNGNRYESTRSRGLINGHLEIDHIYRLQLKLIPALENAGFNVINIKAEPHKAYTADEKIDASNEIRKERGAALHMAVHADATGVNGFNGVTVVYETGEDSSKKIAEQYVRDLIGAGLEARIMPDNQTRVGSLGELRRTDTPSVYFEIGNQESETGLALLLNNNHLQKIADSIAASTKTLLEE